MQHRFAAATIQLCAAALALTALAGCATGVKEDSPEWFAERMQADETEGFPRLQDVPPETTANVSDAYWTGVAADVIAAREAMQANPRAEPAPPTDPAGFEREAREEIEETAATH